MTRVEIIQATTLPALQNKVNHFISDKYIMNTQLTSLVSASGTHVSIMTITYDKDMKDWKKEEEESK